MYRYAVNLQDDHLGAANTALGSVGWGAPGTATTWEDVDLFKNTGSTIQFMRGRAAGRD